MKNPLLFFVQAAMFIVYPLVNLACDVKGEPMAVNMLCTEANSCLTLTLRYLSRNFGKCM
jgi:hypothetical protein